MSEGAVVEENRETERRQPWRRRLHEVIYEADTPAGKGFDVALLLVILLSIVAVMLDSVAEVRQQYGTALRVAEWAITVLFTVEYVLRLVCVRRPLSYALSFYGVVDLLAIIPTYLSLFLGGTHSLLVIRALRLLRVFRVFKLTRYLGEITALLRALRATRAKIIVFLATVLTLALILGALMYLIEGEEGGFASIPDAVYWAIVTITTVGYGDIAPHSLPGKLVAAAAMIIGYSIIIIPTGIFAMEMVRTVQAPATTQACPACSREGHDADARFCKFCGASLD